jgi:thiamine-phosphate pyrophosphorylase
MEKRDFSLYLITDRHQTGGRPLVDVVHAALEGGVRAVQLREKDLPGSELYRLATELRRLTVEFGARLIINDRTDIALAVDADGVHIGVSSLPVAVTRTLLGSEKTIGYSAHAITEAHAAHMAGADFVSFGPVFHTPSKAAFGSPCGTEMLAEAVAALALPVIALGGINSTNLDETMASAPCGIAVIAALMAAADPRLAAVSLLKKIEEYAQHS